MWVKDVTMTERVVIQSTVRTPEIEELETTSHLISEEIMDKIGQFTGQGDAKLTVGATLGSNIEYGFSAQSFVSVTIVCGSSEEDIQGSYDVVQPYVQELCMQNHDRLSETREGMLKELGKVPDKVRATKVQKAEKKMVSSGPPKKKGAAIVAKPLYKR